MLVLTRKSQETVVVGGSAGFQVILKVTVLSIKAGKVRLGFEVPVCSGAGNHAESVIRLPRPSFFKDTRSRVGGKKVGARRAEDR